MAGINGEVKVVMQKFVIFLDDDGLRQNTLIKNNQSQLSKELGAGGARRIQGRPKHQMQGRQRRFEVVFGRQIRGTTRTLVGWTRSGTGWVMWRKERKGKELYLSV